MAAVTFTSAKTEYQFYLKLIVEEIKAGTASSNPQFSYKLQLCSGKWNFNLLRINAYVKIGNTVVAQLKSADKQWTLDINSSITLLSGTTGPATNNDVSHNGSANISVEYNIDMNESFWGPAPDITATGTMPVTAYTKWTAVTSPSITYNDTVIIPGNNLTINWSGAKAGTNNAISGYILKIRRGSNTGTEVYSESITSATQTSKTVSTSSFATRGDTLYASIQALGSVSGYDGQVKSNVVGRVNSLPAAPSVSVSGAQVTSSSSMIFSVTAGSDAENQARTLYYSLDNGGKTSFTSPLTISSTNNLSAGTHTINFYTYDGLEYSNSATSKVFTVVTAPQIGSASINHTYVKDMKGNSNLLVTKSTISYTLTSGKAISVDVKIRTGSSSGSFGSEQSVTSSAITFNASTKTATIDIGKISTSILGYGEYFQFRFRLYDGSAYSSYSNWSSATGRRAYLPQTPSSVTISNNAVDSSLANSEYYKNSVNVKATNFSATDGYAQVTEISIIASYGNTTKSFPCAAGAGASINQNLDLSTVGTNVSTSFYFQVKDVLGQVSKSSILTTLTKSPDISYAGTSISINPSNLRPLSNTNPFTIAHPYATVGNAGSIKYTYQVKIGTKTASITSYEVNTNNPTQMIITITANNIKTLVTSVAPNTTSAYSASIIVMATDGFGSALSLAGTFTVDFTEPPYFISDSLPIKIKHDYQVSSTVLSTSVGIEVPTTIPTSPNENLYKLMFNMGEGIIFLLPKTSDPNNDISEYLIYSARINMITGQTAPDVNNITFDSEPLIRVPYSTATQVSDSNYYYYRYNMPQLSKNEYWYFKIKVRDSTGNESSEKIYSSCIIGCKTAQPNFNVSNIKISKNDNVVTLGYDFKITDLGGSATSDGWNQNFYNSYPNFERTIANYTPTVILKIEIAPNQEFSSGVVLAGNFIGGSPLSEFTHNGTTVSGFTGEKVFIRFTLSVSYSLNTSNQNVYMISNPQIYTWLGEMPTVAHRSHHVGINTKDFSDEDVLVVQNYLGRRYVILKSNDINNTKTIIVDLVNGTVDGAVMENTIINCGTW